jgi:hypothetical protein
LEPETYRVKLKKLQKLEIFKNILFFMKFGLFDSLHEPVGEIEKTSKT